MYTKGNVYISTKCKPKKEVCKRKFCGKRSKTNKPSLNEFCNETKEAFKSSR
jgi:hypothetical protein